MLIHWLASCLYYMANRVASADLLTWTMNPLRLTFDGVTLCD